MSNQIEYRKFPHGQKCDYQGCGSRRYYIADGKQFCRNGHEQQGFSQVQADEDDFNSQGRKTRLKRAQKERVELVLSGRAATELFLQAYQLVLWKQVAWLVAVKSLPAELETIVRDLWAVRLRAVKGFGEESGGTSDGESSFGGTNVGFSSMSEDEVGSDATGSTGALEMGKRRKKAARHNGLPKLMDSLGLCYLGILLLRLPISLGQLQRWAEREDIIYMRAIREVPKEMRARLPAYYHSALEARAPLKKGDLHKSVLELVISYKQRYDITFPPLNSPLVLFKHVRDLCLPVDIYVAVQRMAKVLKTDFSFPNTLSRHNVTAYPENQIVSLIVIATKLSQPFDDIVRTPNNVTDPSALGISWENWLDSMSDPPSKGIKRGDEIRISDEDVLMMDDNQLDDYLNWYQRTWIDDRDAKMPEQILELFPLEYIPPIPEEKVGQSDDDLSNKRIKTVQANLVWHKPVISEEGQEGRSVNRPGSFYKYYRNVNDLSEKARGFYEKAAENAGLSLDMLLRAVYLTERRLQVWIMAERRKRTEEDLQQLYKNEEMSEHTE